jgi:hypothetical protein
LAELVAKLEHKSRRLHVPHADVSDVRFAAASLLQSTSASGRYEKLCIATPMRRSQLCVVARRRMAVDESRRGPREPDAMSIYT